MLHVLLLILKITGIVIACILGLVILVVTAVLFVPVRYKVNADYHEVQGTCEIVMAWNIMGACFNDEEPALKPRHFITIYSNNQKEKLQT
ncbi:MAG: hypothetical protein ACLTKH_00540 [Eubacterium sp.]